MLWAKLSHNIVSVFEKEVPNVVICAVRHVCDECE
jgi:hypothetical protein